MNTIIVEPQYVPEPGERPVEPTRPAHPLGWGEALAALLLLPASYVVFGVLVGGVAAIVIKLNHPEYGFKQVAAAAQGPGLVVLAALAAQLFAVAYVVWRVRRRMSGRTRQGLGLSSDLPPVAWIGAPILALVPLFLVPFLAVLAQYAPPPEEMPILRMVERASAFELALLVVFGVALAPFCEELFFRGFLYPIAARYLSTSGAVLAVTLAFVALHVSQTGGYWISMVMISLVGIILGVQRARFNSILPAWITHTCYNLALMLISAAALLVEATGRLYHYAQLYAPLLPG